MSSYIVAGVPLAAESSAMEIGSSFGGSKLTGCLGAKFLGSGAWPDIAISVRKVWIRGCKEFV